MAQVQDPVCGMMIEETDAVATTDYDGERYYFCSRDCKDEFDAHPDDYESSGKDDLR
jgi:YHS domain-containing protein